jgi:predicted nucleic acid-binding protein
LANLFVDSSALAKRYTHEIGTVWVRSWTKSSAGNLIIIGELALVEVFSVFARRAYDGDLTPNSAERFRRIFSAHIRDEYSVIGINGALLASAQTLVTHHIGLGLRALDAIQLACALRAQITLQQPVTFVSADVKLLNAAVAEGFKVDNPNQHP